MYYEGRFGIKMKKYILVALIGYIIILTIRTVSDINNKINPLQDLLSVAYYLILLFWIILFAYLYFKKK